MASQVVVGTSRGSVLLEIGRHEPPPAPISRVDYVWLINTRPRDYATFPLPVAGGSQWAVPGVIYTAWTAPYTSGPGSENHRCLFVRHWLVVALLFVSPMLWAIAALRRRGSTKRLAQGQCVSCGYDLRASPARCPEYGMIPDVRNASRPVQID